MTIQCVKDYFLQINVFTILLLQIVPIAVALNARISLNVEGEGFHRNLTYRVEYDEFKENCYSAIHLALPPALYVNIDELADLRRLGVSTACAVGETDVELFMEKAKPQDVTVCGPLTTREHSLYLPIHQRYQYARKDGGYATVVLPRPKLLLGCKDRIKEHRVSKTDLCTPCVELVPKWRDIPYIMNQEDIVWLVPVGNSSVLTPITYITLLTTILAAIFITRTIFKTVEKEPEKKD